MAQNIIKKILQIFILNKVKNLNKVVTDLNEESLVKKRLLYERNLTVRNTIVIGNICFKYNINSYAKTYGPFLSIFHDFVESIRTSQHVYRIYR